MSIRRFVLAAAIAFAAAAPALLPDPAAAQDGPDWKNDAPGRVHRIDVEAMPEPYATESNVNFPRIVPRPDGAELELPAGFTVDVFTRATSRARA